MGSVSEQFRGHTGLGDPDPSLGLENAKANKGGKGEPVEVEDTLHPTTPEATKVDTKTEKPAKKTAAKKTAAKKATAKKK